MVLLACTPGRSDASSARACPCRLAPSEENGDPSAGWFLGGGVNNDARPEGVGDLRGTSALIGSTQRKRPQEKEVNNGGNAEADA